MENLLLFSIFLKCHTPASIGCPACIRGFMSRSVADLPYILLALFSFNIVFVLGLTKETRSRPSLLLYFNYAFVLKNSIHLVVEEM